jgi:hypothetical protein
MRLPQFMIRDLMWAMVVVGLASALCVQGKILDKAQRDAAVSEVRLECVDVTLRGLGYRLVTEGLPGPCAIEPTPPIAGPPIGKTSK